MEGLTDDDIDDPIPKTEVLDKNIGHATSWVKWQAWSKQKKAMRAQKVKPLDIENGYMYHKKAQYVENFNDFLIMIFFNHSISN